MTAGLLALTECILSQRFYHLLFRTSAAAAQHLAGGPRFVGGQMGLMGVLHTWGRSLSYHVFETTEVKQQEVYR